MKVRKVKPKTGCDETDTRNWVKVKRISEILQKIKRKIERCSIICENTFTRNTDRDVSTMKSTLDKDSKTTSESWFESWFEPSSSTCSYLSDGGLRVEHQVTERSLENPFELSTEAVGVGDGSEGSCDRCPFATNDPF